jgi:predicted nucleic acid-binding protein
MACVFQRQIREFKVPSAQVIRAREFFLADLQSGVWSLLPITESSLLRAASAIAALPASMYSRAGDAIHLAAAQGAGFTEIWSNDKRLLQAAPSFGLSGKSV